MQSNELDYLPFFTAWIETLYIIYCCYAIESANSKYHIINHLSNEGKSMC